MHPYRRPRLSCHTTILTLLALLVGMALMAFPLVAVQAAPLNICAVEDNYPFAYREAGGTLTGFDIDLWKALNLPLSYALVAADFPTALARLEAKSCDMVLSNITITSQRSKRFLFAAPHLYAGLGAMVRADAPYKKSKDLQEAVLVVLKGSGAEQFVFATYTRSVILALPTEHDAFLALQQGKAKAFVHDRPMLQKFLSQDSTLRLLEDDLTPLEYAYIFRKGSEALRDQVTQALRAADEQGVIRQLYLKWFGAPLPEKRRP